MKPPDLVKGPGARLLGRLLAQVLDAGRGATKWTLSE